MRVTVITNDGITHLIWGVIRVSEGKTLKVWQKKKCRSYPWETVISWEVTK